MKSKKGLGVIGVALLVAGWWATTENPQEREQKLKEEKRKERFAKAEAMFQERCKKSGEFIYRTAKNVESVFLLKLRSDAYPAPYNQMDDPYGNDFAGGEYIRSFLQARNENGYFSFSKVGGYRYVDAIDTKDGKRYRYTGYIKAPQQQNFKAHTYLALDKILAPDPAPRYGVTYDDISTREERDYWIAGSSLRVIDLETNEVMAERIGYMVDPVQGDYAAWVGAREYACPSFPKEYPGGAYQTRNFVEKVLPVIPEK